MTEKQVQLARKVQEYILTYPEDLDLDDFYHCIGGLALKIDMGFSQEELIRLPVHWVRLGAILVLGLQDETHRLLFVLDWPMRLRTRAYHEIWEGKIPWAPAVEAIDLVIEGDGQFPPDLYAVSNSARQ